MLNALFVIMGGMVWILTMSGRRQRVAHMISFVVAIAILSFTGIIGFPPSGQMYVLTFDEGIEGPGSLYNSIMGDGSEPVEEPENDTYVYVGPTEDYEPTMTELEQREYGSPFIYITLVVLTLIIYIGFKTKGKIFKLMWKGWVSLFKWTDRDKKRKDGKK